MAIVQGQVGTQTNSVVGSSPIFRTLYSGELGVGRVHATYQEAVCRGNVYSLYQCAGAQVTAIQFPYAAGGKPLIALFNPPGSGKDMILLAAGNTVETAGTTAVPVTIGLSLTTTLVTTTVTRVAPTNMLTLLTTGSVGFGVLSGSSGVALTANTIQYSEITIPLLSIGLTTVTTAVPNPTPGFVDLGGLIIVAPGNQLTIGASSIAAAASIDSTIIWEEVPVAS